MSKKIKFYQSENFIGRVSKFCIKFLRHKCEICFGKPPRPISTPSTSRLSRICKNIYPLICRYHVCMDCHVKKYFHLCDGIRWRFVFVSKASRTKKTKLFELVQTKFSKLKTLSENFENKRPAGGVLSTRANPNTGENPHKLALFLVF